jgi:hypothetical protein
MPYPEWLDWNAINRKAVNDGSIITHFRGTDGYPACGCWRLEPNAKQRAMSRSTDNPREVTCGRCMYTHALNEVA